ncbi:MAG: hypothetical protein ACRYFY_05130 [Janthinobacterium lividum]
MRLLLVEDNPELAAQVRAASFELDYAATRANALAVLENRDYALAIVDLGLPDGGGSTCCRASARSGATCRFWC